MRIPVLALTLSLVLVPMALADNAMEITVSSDFRQLALDAHIEVEGADAANMRAMMDSTMTGGNGDGTVSQAEADQIESLLRDTMSEETGESVGDNVTMDGALASNFTLEHFDISGAPGPISSTAPITMEIAGFLTFQAGPGARHVLVWRSTSEGDDTMAISVHAPAGYVITSATGLPAGAVSGDRRSVEFVEDAGTGESSLVFEPAAAATSAQGTGKASPAAPLALLVASLALAARIRRAA